MESGAQSLGPASEMGSSDVIASIIAMVDGLEPSEVDRLVAVLRSVPSDRRALAARGLHLTERIIAEDLTTRRLYNEAQRELHAAVARRLARLDADARWQVESAADLRMRAALCGPELVRDGDEDVLEAMLSLWNDAPAAARPAGGQGR